MMTVFTLVVVWSLLCWVTADRREGKRAAALVARRTTLGMPMMACRNRLTDVW